MAKAHMLDFSTEILVVFSLTSFVSGQSSAFCKIGGLALTPSPSWTSMSPQCYIATPSLSCLARATSLENPGIVSIGASTTLWTKFNKLLTYGGTETPKPLQSMSPCNFSIDSSQNATAFHAFGCAFFQVAVGDQCPGEGVTLFVNPGFNLVSNNSWVRVPVPTRDLSSIHFDDMTKSVCINGIWLFYDHVNYNPSSDTGVGGGQVEVYYGLQRTHCIDLPLLLDGKVASVRSAGDPSRRPRVDFFSRPYFSGDQFYTLTGSDHLKGYPVQSLIVSGSSPWTICDQTHMQGRCTCVYPKNSTWPAPGVYASPERFTVSGNSTLDKFSVLSVGIGCLNSSTKSQLAYNQRKIIR